MGKNASPRNSGAFWIFLSWTSLFLIVGMMAVLGILICWNSFNALWPNPVERVRLDDGTVFLGFPVNDDISPDGRARLQFKVGNRELNSGADFRWVFADAIAERDRPREAAVVERMENGVFLGLPAANGTAAPESPESLAQRLDAYRARWNAECEPLRRRLAELGDAWQRTHLAALKTAYELGRAPAGSAKAGWETTLRNEKDREASIKAESENLMARFNEAKQHFTDERTVFATAAGANIPIQLESIIDVTYPNALSFALRVHLFLVNVWNLLTRYPREANTEGGIFPALFGTVVLVFLMAISAFPLGVAAGVYLREYAKDGVLSRTARVAVNNLAGVPSIVYGIFGLGFFIYGMGGTIDALLYPERVAAGISTFGGGGVIWSSLTLGLLTLPVVIVATEEALATVPSEIRQGSLALGATRFQTLWRVVLPMASPGILTGFILAMARAAGEVAPLMLTGAVKSAHSLPLDATWPFVHLERKFMHLGFHIHDMGFQSPNVEASKPLVYVTALVLLVLVFVLNVAAISLRRRMRDKYAMKGF